MSRPATQTVRAVTPADWPAVRGVVTDAFGRAAEATLVDELRSGGHARVELVAAVATAEAADTAEAAEVAVRGHVLFSELPIASGGRPLLALAPLAVAPACQRLGIGTALVEAGLAAADAGGWPAVVVLGDPDYYGRFGFGPAAELGVTGPYGAGAAFQARRLSAYAGESGEVRYPEPFARV